MIRVESACMSERGEFWSELPDWEAAVLAADGVSITVVPTARVLQLSGRIDGLLAGCGIATALGPRDVCDTERYALRLAPASALLVSTTPFDCPSGWVEDGAAISDLSAGIQCFDVSGSRAGTIMALGAEYDFDARSELPLESSRLRFAGLRVAVCRRPGGWRLHIERPWAPALWRWLAAAFDGGQGKVQYQTPQRDLGRHAAQRTSPEGIA
jgi:sarcosine oxidase gamma subunit